MANAMPPRPYAMMSDLELRREAEVTTDVDMLREWAHAAVGPSRVRDAIATNPALPADLIEGFLDDARRAKAASARAKTYINEYTEDARPAFLAMRNRVATSEILDAVVADETIPDFVRVSVAGNKNVSSEAIETLASGESPALRHGAARSRRTPPALLTALAHDEDWRVASNAVSNAKLPIEVATRLLRESDEPRIRASAAGRKGIPVEALLEAMGGDDRQLRTVAAKNPALTSEIVGSMFTSETDGYTLNNLAKHPNLPLSVAEDASRSTSAKMRNTSVRVPGISLETLARLSQDPNRDVSRVAISAARKRIPQRLGFSPENREALEEIMELDWGNLTKDSPEVLLILAVHGDI